MKIVKASEIENISSVPVDFLKESSKFIYKLGKTLQKFCKTYSVSVATANQFGIRKKVMAFRYNDDTLVTAINPSYSVKGTRENIIEVCLLYPDRYFRVQRYKTVHVSFTTFNKIGIPIIRNITLDGESSFYYQQGVDTLNGVTVALKGSEVTLP